MTFQVMRSQQRKIEEQRTIIEHLRNKLNKTEEYLDKINHSQITTLQKSEISMVASSSEKLAVKIVDYEIMNDSDSAINTDSGSETGKQHGSQMSKISKMPRLSRSLSDVQVSKKIRDQYLSRGQPLQTICQHSRTLYPNHRSVQRPRDVKKRHWRKSCPVGMASCWEDIFT